MPKHIFHNNSTPYINEQSLNDNFAYLLPTGAITIFAGSTAPDGYLICDGAEIDRTEYAELFSIIGTSFGIGDGSTTFNLPNLKGKVPVGYDNEDTTFNTLGTVGGEKEHTLTTLEMPSHWHQIFDADGGTTPFQPYTAKSNGSIGGTAKGGYGSITNAVGNGNAHNNLQPYIVMNYIIKY